MADRRSDAEIIKALGCCQSSVACAGFACPYVGAADCLGELTRDALSLISCQKAELLKEKNKNSKLRNERNRQKAEIEHLNCVITTTAECAYEARQQAMKWARVETAKELSERLKTKFDQYGIGYYPYVLVDDVVSEMGGDTDDL